MRERDVLHPHLSPTQNNRTTSYWAQRNNLKAPSADRPDGSASTDGYLKSFCYTAVGTVDFYCNVAVWILHSGTQFTKMHPSASLCVHSLLLSRMQRVAGLGWGWGKWDQCFRVLSPCNVIVDRDGSCSEWGQRRGNNGPHHRTWGWQLFGLHRYCSCFLMILNESLCTNVCLWKCQAGLRQWLRQEALKLLNLFTGNLITGLIRACAFTRPHSSVEKCNEWRHHLMFHPNKHTQRILVWRKWAMTHVL